MYGNKVCYQKLCTKVGDDCSPGISSQANDRIACSQMCQNRETCEMAAYDPNTGVCNIFTCRHCYLEAGTDEGQTVYFCTAGNVRTDTCTSTFQSHRIFKQALCGLDCDIFHHRISDVDVR